jgi:hypothetical protein
MSRVIFRAASIVVIFGAPLTLPGSYLGNLIGVLCILLMGFLMEHHEVLGDGNVGGEDG